MRGEARANGTSQYEDCTWCSSEDSGRHQAITLAMEETGLSRIEVLCDGSEGEIPESELRQIKVTDRDKPGSPVIGTAWDFLRKQKTPGYLFGSEY